MKTALKTEFDVFAHLARHVGRDHAQTCAAIARALDITEGRVCTLVSSLREYGIAVCRDPASGYYLPADFAEFERACVILRSNALTNLYLEATLRKIPLRDLVAQIYLGT